MATLSKQPQISYERHQKTIQFFTETLDKKLTIEMVQIPAGIFTMGSPKDEPERHDTEGPQHNVSVNEFFMSRYPVTQAQWCFVAGLLQISQELKTDPSNFKGDNFPVEQVSWYEAIEFCQRLSTHTGREYRLPTEAEWEYACRAETTTPFHFGEIITTAVANYRGTSYTGRPEGEYRKKTTPVDHFGIANAFGLCDMHGNVWEWCQDHWHTSYEGAPTVGSAWLTSKENSSRIVRGGSWRNTLTYCRSASRNDFMPDSRLLRIGFRVVFSALKTLS